MRLSNCAIGSVASLTLLAGSSAAFGQCVSGWQAVGDPTNSALGGIVQAMTVWDSDGDGPLPPMIVATGSFPTAGTNSISRIAMWDGTNWQPFGAGISDGRSLKVRANGDLIVGGAFPTADGQPASRIAYWSPGASTFGAFGDGQISIVTTVNLYGPDEQVIAGGFSPGKIASWDGTSWNSMNGGVSSTVTCSAILANGDLVIGGGFMGVNVNPDTSASDPAKQIARWDGSTWSPLGDGIAAGSLRCMLALPNGHLIVGGGFNSAGPVTNVCNYIAEWDGTAWHPMGQGMTGSGTNPGVYALALLPNGDIAAAGNFDTADGAAAHKVARWNGSSWAPMGASGMNNTVYCLTQLNGELYAAGDFTTADGHSAIRFAKFGSSTQAVADVGMVGGLPGSDGHLDNNDFIAFITDFFNTAPVADMGVAGGLPGSDGHFDNNDFIAFINAFFNGCH